MPSRRVQRARRPTRYQQVQRIAPSIRRRPTQDSPCPPIFSLDAYISMGTGMRRSEKGNRCAISSSEFATSCSHVIFDHFVRMTRREESRQASVAEFGVGSRGWRSRWTWKPARLQNDVECCAHHARIECVFEPRARSSSIVSLSVSCNGLSRTEPADILVF